MDYLFIIENDGRIVYKNKGIELIDFFKDVKEIDIEDLLQMYSIPIELREANGNKFIKVCIWIKKSKWKQSLEMAVVKFVVKV